MTIRRYTTGHTDETDGEDAYLCDDCAEDHIEERFGDGTPMWISFDGGEVFYEWIEDDEDCDHSCEECNESALDKLPI